MACSFCGKEGHNIKTCKEAAAAKESKREIEQHKPAERKCGECRQPGHDKRQCPQLIAPAKSPAKVVAPEAKKERKCGNCRKPGHDKRQCPETTGVASDDDDDESDETEIVPKAPSKIPNKDETLQDKICRLVGQAAESSEKAAFHSAQSALYSAEASRILAEISKHVVSLEKQEAKTDAKGKKTAANVQPH
eukprot:TRINITY_DN2031_c0_g1_i1.p2 TRINITY_DN2031_c0_g1~~TRINITY_DN2031_c0_g1_i1.p2  ORF type:complete len:201 (-),score=70.99 TRINITY_DN2031_c0_g1_i1:87-662(-)